MLLLCYFADLFIFWVSIWMDPRIYPCGFALQLARSYGSFLHDGPKVETEDRGDIELIFYFCHIYIYFFILTCASCYSVSCFSSARRTSTCPAFWLPWPRPQVSILRICGWTLRCPTSLFTWRVKPHTGLMKRQKSWPKCLGDAFRKKAQ